MASPAHQQADEEGRCPRHPSVRLMRRSTTRAGGWTRLLGSCPLCQMDPEDRGDEGGGGRRSRWIRRRRGAEPARAPLGPWLDGLPLEVRLSGSKTLRRQPSDITADIPAEIRFGKTAGERGGDRAAGGGGRCGAHAKPAGGGDDAGATGPGIPLEIRVGGTPWEGGGRDGGPAAAPVGDRADPSEGPATASGRLRDEPDGDGDRADPAPADPSPGPAGETGRAGRGASFDRGGDMSREFVVYSSDEEPEPGEDSDRAGREASFDRGGDMSREYVVYSSDEECLDDDPGQDNDGSRHSGVGRDDDRAPLVNYDCVEADRPAPPGVDASERSASTVPVKKVSFRTDLHQPATRRRSVSFDGSSSAPSSAPSASLLRRPRYRVDATLMRRQLYALGGVPRMSDDVSIDVDDLLSSGGEESIDPDDLLNSDPSNSGDKATRLETRDGGGMPEADAGPVTSETGRDAAGGAHSGAVRSDEGSAGAGGGVPPAFGGLYRDIDRGRGAGGEEDAPSPAPTSPRGGRRRAGRVQFVNRSQFEAVVMNS